MLFKYYLKRISYIFNINFSYFFRWRAMANHSLWWSLKFIQIMATHCSRVFIASEYMVNEMFRSMNKRSTGKKEMTSVCLPLDLLEFVNSEIL
jgi:hypothetical protein